MKNKQANSVAVERNLETPTENLATIDPIGQLSLIDGFLEREGITTIEHDESAYLAFTSDINAPSPAKDTDEEWLEMMATAIDEGKECVAWDYEATTNCYCKACTN